MPIILVPAEHVEKLFHLAAPMLDRAIAYTNGGTSLPRVYSEVINKSKQLWFVQPEESGPPKAAGVTSLQKNEDGSITANVELLGGEGMKQWFDLRPELEAWARAEGCSDIRFHGRKEWARLMPDYKITHYIMRKEL